MRLARGHVNPLIRTYLSYVSSSLSLPSLGSGSLYLFTEMFNPLYLTKLQIPFAYQLTILCSLVNLTARMN